LHDLLIVVLQNMLALCHSHKIPETSNLERLFWLMVSEVSVHGQLAPLFLEGIRPPWQKTVVKQSCFPHGSQEAERQ
jgi:hypothetical protein